jgi:hypothetical protein
MFLSNSPSSPSNFFDTKYLFLKLAGSLWILHIYVSLPMGELSPARTAPPSSSQRPGRGRATLAEPALKRHPTDWMDEK